MEHCVTSPLYDIPPEKYLKHREDTITTACSLDIDLRELDNHFEEFLDDKHSSICQSHTLSNELQQVKFAFGLTCDIDKNTNVLQSFKHTNFSEKCPIPPTKFDSTRDVISYVTQKITSESLNISPLYNNIFELKNRVDVNFFKKGQIISKFFKSYWMIPTILSVYFDNFLTLILSMTNLFKSLIFGTNDFDVISVKHCFYLANNGNITKAIILANKLLNSNNDDSTSLNDTTIKDFKVTNSSKLMDFLQNHCKVISPKQTLAALKTTLNFIGDISANCNIIKPKSVEVENLLGCLNLQAGYFFTSIFHFFRALSLNSYDINTLTNLTMLYNKFELKTEMWSTLSLLNTIIQNDIVDMADMIKVERVTAIILSKSLGREGTELAKTITNNCLNETEKLKNYPELLKHRLLCNLVEIHIRLNEFKDGIKLANDLTEKYPHYANLWFLSAKIKFHNGDFSGALGDILKSIKLDPYLTPAHLYACKILTKLGHLPAAWISFKNCVYSDPNALELHSSCGQIIASIGLENYILKFYSNLAWIYPNSKLAHMFLTTFKTLDVTSDNKHIALFKRYAKKIVLTVLSMTFIDFIYHKFKWHNYLLRSL